MCCLVSDCNTKIFRKKLCRWHYDEQRFASRPACLIDSCNNKSRHNGLCKYHYTEQTRILEIRICSIGGCDRPYEKKGFCGTHYQQSRTTNQIKKCNIEYCNKVIVRNSLCAQHWWIKQKQDKETLFLRQIRTRITNSITNGGWTKNSATFKLIGLEYKVFREYIESQFEPWMSWDNYGKWQIDHICPCNQAKSQEEIIKLQNYKNLRPLHARLNHKKSDKATPEALIKCVDLLNREWMYD